MIFWFVMGVVAGVVLSAVALVVLLAFYLWRASDGGPWIRF